MDITTVNKIVLTMKPLLIALFYAIYVFITNRKIMHSIFISLIYGLIWKTDAVSCVLYVFNQTASSTIEIIDTSRTTIEIIVYAVTSLATIYGIIKGWGYFKNQREKKKSIFEENEELVNHTRFLTQRIKELEMEAIKGFEKKKIDLNDLHKLNDEIRLLKAERETVILRCKNQCYDS